jgi:hypothetical protein
MKKKNDTPVSSTNKIDSHNITEILLKVVLNRTQYKNLTLRSFKLSAVRILDKVKLIENILIKYGWNSLKYLIS